MEKPEYMYMATCLASPAVAWSLGAYCTGFVLAGLCGWAAVAA